MKIRLVNKSHKVHKQQNSSLFHPSKDIMVGKHAIKVCVQVIIAMLVATRVTLVRGITSKECVEEYGAVPTPRTCDSFTHTGSLAHLNNEPTDQMNTEEDDETSTQIRTRLSGLIPSDPDNIRARYNPVFDAFCFNEDYPVPSLSPSQQNTLYLDYKISFDRINRETDDVSDENNDVTNNRIPGMFLRMCFHDNSIDPAQPDFQQYIASLIHPVTKKWIGESRYLKTSGADASLLICPEERFHPNQNYDQTASRVLRSIQTELKTKYPQMSYADLLHNGCNAATIYLAGQNPSTSLVTNPFTFGRKDACHADTTCTKKYALCGPTELLPGVALTSNEVTSWFTSRGMSECLFMGLMWTHTTMDNMASLCPLKRLVCRATSTDVKEFDEDEKLYFRAGDNLDYFNFFLNRGTHQTLPDTGDDSDPNCIWRVQNRRINWPMTGIDCTIGLSNVEKGGPVALAAVIRNFVHNSSYNRVDILQCALKVLGGTGGSEGGACNLVGPAECKSNPRHKFGGFYSTLRQSNKERVTVDPNCEVHGY